MAIRFSPIFRYTVTGNSMKPAFQDGSRVLVNRLSYKITSPKKGDVIVLKHPKREFLLIKRIKKIDGKGIFVEGDNKKESTDSRDIGYIEKKNIIGKVFGVPAKK